MNGELAEGAALVSYGNAFLHSGVQPEISWSTHSAFRYVSVLRFIHRDRIWRRTVAERPEAWFSWLKLHGVVSLRLAITSTNGWVIRTSGTPRDCIWRSRLRYIGDRDDGRIWSLTYKGSAESGGGYREALRVLAASESLRSALDDMIRFTRSRQLLDWEPRFIDAQRTFTTGAPVIPYHPDLLMAPSDDALRLAAASAKAWVFDGAGSWNDVEQSGVPRREYREVTSRLYKAVLDGIASAVND